MTLALNPADLFDVGCQLSFLAVAAIVWLVPAVLAWDAPGADPARRPGAAVRAAVADGSARTGLAYVRDGLIGLGGGLAGGLAAGGAPVPPGLAGRHPAQPPADPADLAGPAAGGPVAGPLGGLGAAGPARSAWACGVCLGWTEAVVRWGTAWRWGHAFVPGPRLGVGRWPSTRLLGLATIGPGAPMAVGPAVVGRDGRPGARSGPAWPMVPARPGARRGRGPGRRPRPGGGGPLGRGADGPLRLRQDGRPPRRPPGDRPRALVDGRPAARRGDPLPRRFRPLQRPARPARPLRGRRRPRPARLRAAGQPRARAGCWTRSGGRGIPVADDRRRGPDRPRRRDDPGRPPPRPGGPDPARPTTPGAWSWRSPRAGGGSC